MLLKINGIEVGGHASLPVAKILLMEEEEAKVV
jgi:hypothetical protein